MADQGRGATGHERVLALALAAGFLVLVAAVVGIYLAASAAIHGRLRPIVPAAVRSFRIPAMTPAGLVLAAAVIVMAVAFVAILVRDARHATPDDNTGAEASRPRA